ncbi:hypothetical protein OIU84_014062 [Salix udensis]|uniref:Uncharacterized protein n=1 Tax=Salix udensis TaxID=889485 RepID=A0AAD6NRK8_9ROSI|nr:hypothetical protein OIU84_014062 [Salix udensis]
MFGRYLQRAILCFVKPILILLGEPETEASAASVFVYGLIPPNFVYAVNFPEKSSFKHIDWLDLPSFYMATSTINTMAHAWKLEITFLNDEAPDCIDVPISGGEG